MDANLSKKLQLDSELTLEKAIITLACQPESVKCKATASNSKGRLESSECGVGSSISQTAFI